MKECHSSKYTAEFIDENKDKEKEQRFFLDAVFHNISKEKTEEIVCELETVKEHIKKILAG